MELLPLHDNAMHGSRSLALERARHLLLHEPPRTAINYLMEQCNGSLADAFMAMVEITSPEKAFKNFTAGLRSMADAIAVVQEIMGNRNGLDFAAEAHGFGLSFRRSQNARAHVFSSYIRARGYEGFEFIAREYGLENILDLCAGEGRKNDTNEQMNLRFKVEKHLPDYLTANPDELAALERSERAPQIARQMDVLYARVGGLGASRNFQSVCRATDNKRLAIRVTRMLHGPGLAYDAAYGYALRMANGNRDEARLMVVEWASGMSVVGRKGERTGTG
jgi:hypothetical protein